jgi:hypothetical protein
MKIISKKIIPYKGVVCDLSVENTATYNVEGLGVHNSAAGSLVSYLIGITLIDPIPYGLLFSRFFNAARAYPKHLSFDEYGFIDEFRDFESKLAKP